MKLTKLLFVQIFLLCCALAPVSLQAIEEEPLPPVRIINSTDLRDDARLSAKTSSPILILFAMQGCSYCRYVEEEHLKPMLRNANYRSKVIIRRIMTDGYDELIDFTGKRISNADFAHRYGAYLTPTVVFFDQNGNSLSRISGVRNTEFYGGDLDEELNLSLRKIRKDKEMASLR